MKRIFIVLLMSLVFQLVFILFLKIPVKRDAVSYDKVAINLVAGKGFSEDGISPVPGYIKQGYILFLASVYKIFGHTIFIVKIIQAVLISLSCIITYKIATELFNEHIGYYSALITALHPAFLIISSHLISESLFIFLLAISIFYLVKAIKRKALGLYLLSGIFLGISTQVRFTPIFFPFFIFMGLLLCYKEKLYAFKAGMIILLAVIIIAVPWTIRNYIHFGYLNPFVEFGGVWWLGSYTKGKAHQDNPEVKKAVAQIDEELNKHYSQKEINSGKFQMDRQAVLLRLAIENIKESPLRYIELCPIKILRLWIGSYSGHFEINIPFSDFVHNRILVKHHPFILLWKLFILSFSLVVFCLGIIGMILGLKKWRKILPLYLIVGYFTLLHMIVFANTRMGIPALPYMIIFASLALFKILDTSRRILTFILTGGISLKNLRK